MSSECPVYTEVVFLGHEFIKDEPDEDNMDTRFSHDDGSSVDVYPMDLLKLGEDSSFVEQASYHFNQYEPDTSVGSTKSKMDPSEEQWQKWMDEYDWLLHDPADGTHGYCLYCNSNLIIKASSAVNKHDVSSIHKERRENYLQFERQEAAKASSSSHPVAVMKTEMTKNNVAALKSKRNAQKAQLNDFNWSRWLQSYEWLERFQTPGTIGYCRFCEVKVNMDCQYLRDRHQNSFRHQEAYKRWMNSDHTTSTTNEATPMQLNRSLSYLSHSYITEINNSESNTSHSDIVPTSLTRSNISQLNSNSEEYNSTEDSNSQDLDTLDSIFELSSVKDNEGRCKVCDVRLIPSSLRKHLKTKLHNNNLRLRKLKKRFTNRQKTVQIKNEGRTHQSTWETINETHPWLQADPENPSFGYCKYCQKRLIYGNSMSKRLLHENSLPHKAAEMLYNHTEINTEECIVDEILEDKQTNDRTDASTNKLMSQVELIQTGKRSGLRAKRGTAAWFRKIPYIQRLSSSRNFVYCTYCEVRLSLTFSRFKHEKSARHKNGERRYKLKQSQKNNESRPSKEISKLEESRRNNVADINDNSQDHACIAKDKYSSLKDGNCDENDSNASNPEIEDEPHTSKLPIEKDNIKQKRSRRLLNSRFLMWKKKFPWLIFNRKRDPNSVYCKYCETFIYAIKMGSVRKHEKTLKHLHARNKKKKVIKTQTDSSTHVPAISINEYSGNIDQFETESPDTPWLMLDRNCKTYGYCKYCNIYLKVDGISKETHEISEDHRQAEETFKQTVDNSNDDVIQMQSASHQEDDDYDEVMSIRSGPSDLNETSGEHSSRHKINWNDVDKTVLKGLSPTQIELFRLICSMNDRNEPSTHDATTSSKILSSLSLATWLANLMQPVNAAAQHQEIPANASERNTFDLFFESVSESVKKLPPDLAAEGKIKVMKIIYDLEVRALQRKENTNDPNLENSESPTTTTNNC